MTREMARIARYPNKHLALKRAAEVRKKGWAGAEVWMIDMDPDPETGEVKLEWAVRVDHDRDVTFWLRVDGDVY